ncbi:hypothetical protein V8D89_000385 [Ganoderma adspersum]
MPATTIPPVARYECAPETHEEIEYATVPIVNFAKVHTPEGRAEIAPQVRDAMHTYGFVRVVNHGLTQAQRAQADRMVDIADVPFSAVPEDEQNQLVAKPREFGEPKGYKQRKTWTREYGVLDEMQLYSMVRPAFEQQHPKAVQPFLPEIGAFMEHNHFNILHQTLRLLALGLELPEETFVEQHRFDAESLTYLRFGKYYPPTEEDEVKANNVWLKGHTDSSTISMLWSQPVAALQILSPDGKWRFVEYIPNSVVVNVGDAMEMLSGGHYKATIHRVFQPPADQRGYTRLTLLYFAYADHDVRLVPFKDSPVLQRVGIERRWTDEDAPTMKSWMLIRSQPYKETERKNNGVQEQVVDGRVVTYYN